MGCLKGESEVKRKEAKFECKKCGAAVNKKGHVCKPVPLEQAEKKGHKGKSEKKAKGCGGCKKS